jgi:hypothetical protein
MNSCGIHPLLLTATGRASVFRAGRSAKQILAMSTLVSLTEELLCLIIVK